MRKAIVHFCLRRRLQVVVVLVPLFWGGISCLAQPSGGPYGPVQQSYAVPADAAHIYFVAPDGKADAAGAQLDAPTTLESAMERVATTDAIVMRGGTYRTGNLKLNQGITMEPYEEERPVLKGTRVATNWQGLRDNVWRTSWPTLFPQKPADWWQREREGMRTPPHRFNNDMVFVDGRRLMSAGWEGELTTNNFHIDYEHGQVFIGFNPAGHLLEITAFDSALIRTTGEVHGKKSDGRGLVMRGLTLTQYAFRALEVEGHEPEGVAEESTYGKDVVGSKFENVTISQCSRVAGYFHGDGTVFRNCRISDTSTEGIYLIASSDCLLERNIFGRNNVQRMTGYFPAAVKIFNQTHRVVCRDNVVMDQPDSNGIWYDVGNQDGVFVNNIVEGCVDGFFFEISKRVICAGNVFVNCDKGVRILNSTNAQVYHNTFVNAVASFERTERSAVNDHFGWHPSTGPAVEDRDGHSFVGNLLTGDENFHKALLRFEQTKALCGKLTKPQVARLDDNVYVRRGGSSGQGLMVWSPVEGEDCVTELNNLEELRRLHPEYEAHGIYVTDWYGSVFQGPELGNYALNGSLRHAVAEQMPAEVQRVLGWATEGPYAPGAYKAPGQ
jgi:parallel beta-helix repeat protein